MQVHYLTFYDLHHLVVARYYEAVTCRFKTFGHFKTATAVLIPFQGLEMAWLFRNGQLFLLAVLIPHQFDIGRQVCSVAFKCNSCITIKTVYLLKLGAYKHFLQD